MQLTAKNDMKLELMNSMSRETNNIKFLKIVLHNQLYKRPFEDQLKSCNSSYPCQRFIIQRGKAKIRKTLF